MPEDSLFKSLFSTELSKGEQKKKAVLNAVVLSLASRGLDGTTFESVGKLANLRKSHVAYYFPDRESMLQGAIKLVTATAQEVTLSHLIKAESPKEKVLSIVDGCFDWLEKFPEQGKVMLLFYYLSSMDENYKQLHREIREVGAERLALTLQNLSVGKKEAPLLARNIQSLIFGGVVDALSLGNKKDLRLVHARIRSTVEDILS